LGKRQHSSHYQHHHGQLADLLQLLSEAPYCLHHKGAGVIGVGGARGEVTGPNASKARLGASLGGQPQGAGSEGQDHDRLWQPGG